MADREKVIKGLEICTSGGVKSGLKCTDCPYYEDCKINPIKQMLKDVLSLLKAQEPRVIDADEIVLSAEPSKWLWVERKGDYCTEAYKAGKTVSGLIAFDCETPCAFLYCERPDEYGKTWRCWTSRPTEEQREKVKWE